ncbi:MAG: cysteine synthase family protein [Nanoarchaeota archaeon]|nr:cysteine synthase family protein [Nanoarchaeota archaeon]MBU1005948.1 cysteine synthase family protein [Nanoarchaeota archaeon]MBU1947075.1 cysteine synthase family protein [Nanoarchaeota archaeon]
MLYKNILETIGNTPLVRINRLNPNKNVEVYAKLERFNPGGSVKERIGLAMIEAAEKSGELTKDKIILEPTSGNTGIGIAMVATVKGYKTLFVMSEGASVERRKILKAFGADILLTDPKKGTDGAIEKAYEMARDEPDKYFMPDQFNNENNWKAHYNGTGEEIWKQTNGKVTMFVAGIGTSGTLTGVSKRLKEHNKDIKIIAAEPLLGHKLQGLKNMKEAYKPSIYDKAWLDEKVPVKDEDGFEMAKKLAKSEGIFVGMSSGAAMHVALEKAKDMKEGLIVVLLPDGGEKYLSTTLFGE